MAKRSVTSTRKAAPSASKKMKPQQIAQDVVMHAQEARQQPMMSPAASGPTAMANDMVNITHEMIAQRAYEIWREQGGGETENWLRAERELRGSQIATSH